MKMSKFFSVALLIMVALAASCIKKDDPEPNANAGLVGEKGNPRFNLSFTNEENVDMDLYVQDPEGNVVSWDNDSSPTGGQLDVDCNCYGCSQGPTENIYWPFGNNTAPKGTYTFWVEYFDYCSSPSSSSYTIKVLSGNTLKATQTGTLSSGSSAHFTYVHQ